MASRDPVSDEGQALVELALVLPVLMLLTFAIVQLAQVGAARLTLEHAAAEGARIGALTNEDRLIHDTIAEAGRRLDRSRLRVEIDPGQHQPPRTEDPRGSILRVRLTYPVPFVVPGLPQVTLRTTAARRVEWTP